MDAPIVLEAVSVRLAVFDATGFETLNKAEAEAVARDHVASCERLTTVFRSLAEDNTRLRKENTELRRLVRKVHAVTKSV